MTGEKGSEENPFAMRRKKLDEDARRLLEELDEKEAAEKARAKAELERELIEVRKTLINDIDSILAELPPLHMATAGSTVVTSEAFAWFYDESEPLIRPSPDGTTLASGSHDATIKLWNANTGECLRTLERVSLLTVAFSPDTTFSRYELNQIFNDVRAMLSEADFFLSTEDGFEFTVSWNGMK